MKAIHQSTVSMALRCGEQFRRRYIENEIVPPGVAAIRGKSLHKANEVNLKAKIRTGQDEPLSVLLDAAEDAYHKEAAGGVYFCRDELPAKTKILENGLVQALALTHTYHAVVAPEIMPVHVERKFLIDAGFDLPLAGTMDIERSGRVDDLKSSGMKWPDDRIKQEIQPVFYSFAHEHEFGTRPSFRYHILIPYKSGPQRQVQDYTATDNDYEVLKSKIRIVQNIYKVGLFVPAYPGSWWCSEKWCGYWSTCEYVGNKVRRWA